MPSKQDIISEIKNAHYHLQHSVAAKHGGVLVDLTCKTHKCGKKLNREWIERPTHHDAKLEDEVRYITCPTCGVKGQWSLEMSAEPTDKDIKKAQEFKLKEQQAEAKQKLAELDQQIAELHKKKESLSSSLDA